jgi:hypothetical protein
MVFVGDEPRLILSSQSDREPRFRTEDIDDRMAWATACCSVWRPRCS